MMIIDDNENIDNNNNDKNNNNNDITEMIRFMIMITQFLFICVSINMINITLCL